MTSEILSWCVHVCQICIVYLALQCIHLYLALPDNCLNQCYVFCFHSCHTYIYNRVSTAFLRRLRAVSVISFELTETFSMLQDKCCLFVPQEFVLPMLRMAVWNNNFHFVFLQENWVFIDNPYHMGCMKTTCVYLPLSFYADCTTSLGAHCFAHE